MLNVLQWQWQSVYSEKKEPGDRLAEWVGTAASGLDLVVGFVIRLRQDQVDTAGHYLLQSAVLPEVSLRPQNQRALALLQDWLAEPDELGDDWWDAFEQDLRRHRFSFREVV
jgi:hypothetical protein